MQYPPKLKYFASVSYFEINFERNDSQIGLQCNAHQNNTVMCKLITGGNNDYVFKNFHNFFYK